MFHSTQNIQVRQQWRWACNLRYSLLFYWRRAVSAGKHFRGKQLCASTWLTSSMWRRGSELDRCGVEAAQPDSISYKRLFAAAITCPCLRWTNDLITIQYHSLLLYFKMKLGVTPRYLNSPLPHSPCLGLPLSQTPILLIKRICGRLFCDSTKPKRCSIPACETSRAEHTETTSQFHVNFTTQNVTALKSSWSWSCKKDAKPWKEVLSVWSAEESRLYRVQLGAQKVLAKIGGWVVCSGEGGGGSVWRFSAWWTASPRSMFSSGSIIYFLIRGKQYSSLKASVW